MKHKLEPEDITAYIDNVVIDPVMIDEIKKYICACRENSAEYKTQMTIKLLLHNRFSKHRGGALKDKIILELKRRNYS